MPILASILPADTMATSFSYAQAAKGQAATTAATPATQSIETAKDSVNTANNEQPVEPNAVKSGSVEEDTSTNTSLKAQLAAKQAASSAQAEPSATNNTSAAASVTDSRRDDDDAATESSARRSDKSVRSASASTRVTDEAEPKKGSRKPRKGKAGKEGGDDSKKDKPAEQEKEQPKIELVEAPLPSVNIWMQRKETQAAKTTVTLPVIPVARSDSNAAVTDAWPNSQESKKKSKTVESSEATNGAVNGTKAQRKAGDGDAAARRNGARGSRAVEKDSRASEAPPPVGDVTSWPTPETAVKEAVKEEKRKSADKPERPEVEAQDESSAKGRSKDKWERMDFVPSVQFSTPIPSVRGSRGGRGGARGGRDVASRGGHGGAAGAADKPAGSAAQPKTGVEARDRARDGNAPARTNSQPPASNKRASMDVANVKDQRKPPVPASGERVKDSQANSTSEQTGPARERGEGRSDRGRGGYRGRGGHAAPIHGQQSYMANGAYSQAPRSFASPPLHQGGNFPATYGGSQSRGGRGGRGQSNASGTFRGPGSSSNAGRMRQVQANVGQVGWDYTVPVPPTWYEHARQLLIPQLEYYFSVENLVKDRFLRQNMDSQGFVPLHLVMGFTRVREIVADPHYFRVILSECSQLEYVLGDDQIERIRSRTHWAKFVYPDMEQRIESARNPGPQTFIHRSLHSIPVYSNGIVGDYAISFPTGYANSIESGSLAYPVEGVAGQPVTNANSAGAETQLSAHVPEFQPGTTVQAVELSAGPSAKADSEAQHVANDSTQEVSAPLTNGNHPQPTEALQSYSLPSPSHRAHLVMRIRDMRSVTESRIDDVPYPEFRSRALAQRRNTLAGSTPSDMISLYRFWSHFLARHFDLDMFEEFRACAVEDATGETVNVAGLQNLIAFYEAIREAGVGSLVPNLDSLYEEAKKLVARTQMS
ncbi:La domain-containing protein [Colletotrichum musicola]|uniref:La domain-containing protein n=1 Tax=Colletotrichum musicola TaxID=2175873 RepID=A0A8H6NXB3_9PEZI|nr:La domain-containing protein [Colletotrichum musicola]